MKFLPLVSSNVKLNSPSSFELLADLVEELLKMVGGSTLNKKTND